MTDSLITQILEVSAHVRNDRDYRDVLTTLVEEVGELATEIAIDSGHKAYRAPSEDGIVGEALDVIIAAADIIHLAMKHQGFSQLSTEMILMSRAEKKLQKWIDSVQPRAREISDR